MVTWLFKTRLLFLQSFEDLVETNFDELVGLLSYHLIFLGDVSYKNG